MRAPSDRWLSSLREREISRCSACKGASRRVGGGGGHSGRGLCLYTPSTQDRLTLPRHLRGDRALPSGTSFRRQLGVGGGLPRGLGHNLLMRFSSLGSSKMEIAKTEIFDILTIQNDQISYVKHVLAPLYVFFILFGYWGGPKGARAQLACAIFQPRQQKWSPLSPLRGALPKAIKF